MNLARPIRGKRKDREKVLSGARPFVPLDAVRSRGAAEARTVFPDGPEVPSGSHFGIIGASPAISAIFDLILRLGRVPSTVLITGESGTGKELVARAVHRAGGGGREGRPFVAINCGAIPSELMESELFGHERGAFTGANGRKPGKVELARGGTLFLDEITTMPLYLQVKLLRFLQEREFTRLGGSALLRADLRVIAAANVDMRDAVKRGRFREDLFYRLNVVPINVPPLRERKTDIPILCAHFLEKYSERYEIPAPCLTPSAMEALVSYRWPGNVRELENLMERLVVLGEAGRPVQAKDLPEEVLRASMPDHPPQGGLKKEDEFHAFAFGAGGGAGGTYREALRAFERSYLIGVLDKTGWKRSRAARLMKVHRNTLLMKMKALGISPPGGAPAES